MFIIGQMNHSQSLVCTKKLWKVKKSIDNPADSRRFYSYRAQKDKSLRIKVCITKTNYNIQQQIKYKGIKYPTTRKY